MGAPVGIALVAGIAVPAMIIGKITQSLIKPLFIIYFLTQVFQCGLGEKFIQGTRRLVNIKEIVQF